MPDPTFSRGSRPKQKAVFIALNLFFYPTNTFCCPNQFSAKFMVKPNKLVLPAKVYLEYE